jgi:hypothetical protein
MLPSCLSKSRVSHNLDFPETSSMWHDLKIIGLADAVEGRINVIANNGQVCLFITVIMFLYTYIAFSSLVDCANFLDNQIT